MGLVIKIIAECDKCKMLKPVDGINGNCVKLPQGWINNSSNGVLCEDCRKSADTDNSESVED